MKKISILKDKEIRHHQPSSPPAASHCPVTQMLPSTFVAVVVARGVAVAMVMAVVWQWCGSGIGGSIGSGGG